MKLTTQDIIRTHIHEGGFWLLICHQDTMRDVLWRMNERKKPEDELQAVQIETVEDAEKITLLVELFNSLSIKEIKDLIERNPYERKAERVHLDDRHEVGDGSQGKGQ